MSDITIWPEAIKALRDFMAEHHGCVLSDDEARRALLAGHTRLNNREMQYLSLQNETLRKKAVATDTLRAENERLRAALELFACDCTAKHLCAQPDNCVNYIARAALEGK